MGHPAGARSRQRSRRARGRLRRGAHAKGEDKDSLTVAWSAAVHRLGRREEDKDRPTLLIFPHSTTPPRRLPRLRRARRTMCANSPLVDPEAERATGRKGWSCRPEDWHSENRGGGEPAESARPRPRRLPAPPGPPLDLDVLPLELLVADRASTTGRLRCTSSSLMSRAAGMATTMETAFCTPRAPLRLLRPPFAGWSGRSTQPTDCRISRRAGPNVLIHAAPAPRFAESVCRPSDCPSAGAGEPHASGGFACLRDL